MATLAEQLDSVQAAIAAVEAGVQSYTDQDGHSVTYPSLAVLYARERDLQKRIARGDRDRIIVSEF